MKVISKFKREWKKRNKKLLFSIGGFSITLLKILGIFKILGLLFLEDLLAIKLGALFGFTVFNIILIISTSLLLWVLFEKK